MTTTEIKHTPGPWRESSGLKIRCEKGEVIAFITTNTPRTICEDEANTRLIAESPVMYELMLEILHDNRVPIEYAKRALAIEQRIYPVARA